MWWRWLTHINYYREKIIINKWNQRWKIANRVRNLLSTGIDFYLYAKLLLFICSIKHFKFRKWRIEKYTSLCWGFAWEWDHPIRWKGYESKKKKKWNYAAGTNRWRKYARSHSSDRYMSGGHSHSTPLHITTAYKKRESYIIYIFIFLRIAFSGLCCIHTRPEYIYVFLSGMKLRHHY